MSSIDHKVLETQIQYKMIEQLSQLNESLKEEIRVRKDREKELEEERVVLKNTIEQKELLLREVNHRVKNNLQVIKSLLSVQVGLAKSKEEAEVLESFSSRLDSLVLLHTLLYQSDELGEISIRDFIAEIFRSVFDDSVEIDLHCPNFNVYFESMSNLGMIINEIATNSCKHAWTANDTKKVFLSVEFREELILVCYRDNGKKLSATDPLEKGFGMELLNILFSTTENNAMTITPDGALQYDFQMNLGQ